MNLGSGSTRNILRLLVMLPLLSGHFQEGHGLEKQVDSKDTRNGFNRDHSAVYFDPVDFVEYNGLHHKLDPSGLTEMLKLIHTQFDEIMVPFSVPPRQVGNLSNHDILEAAALLNKFLNGSSPSPSSSSPSFLKLVILYKVSKWEDKLLFKSEFQSGRRATGTANSIFPGTVKSIIFEISEEDENFHQHYVQFREFFSGFGRPRQHKFGIQVDIKHCAGSPSELSTQLENDILRDFSVDIAYFSDSFTSQVSGLALDRSLEMSFNRFTPCQKLIESMSNRKELGFMVTWPDTDADGQINRTGLVEFWKSMDGYAGKFQTSVIFLQAFDAPLSPERVMKTNGWWRFLPNSNYNHLSKLVFEEKQFLIMNGSSNFAASQPNMTWLSQETVFQRDLVGIQFNPFVPGLEAGKGVQFSLVPMIEQISTTFSKLLLSTERLDDDMYLGPIGKKQIALSIPGALSRWNFNTSDAKKPLQLIMTFDRTTAREVTKLAQEANRIFNSTVTQLIYAPADFDEESLLDGYAELSNVPRLFERIHLGIKVNAEVCSNTIKFNNLMDLLQLYFSGDFKLKLIYFSETVALQNTILGAERALPLLLVSFENCRGMVKEYMGSSVNSPPQVAFMTGWPIKGDDDSIEGRIQFVRFWELLNDWAVKGNNNVILNSAFDPPTMGTLNDKLAVRYGWWGVTESETLGGPKYLFENKKQAANRLATEPPLTTGPFNLTYIIVPPIALVLAFVIATSLVARHLRKSNYLTREEIAQFLNGGGDQSSSENLKGVNEPYQKGELELSKKSFSIVETSPLGSGAFGKICLGRVSKDEVVQDVAVKMIKVSGARTALRGLLFEIKILAYLGKHPYIVELVGAYTAELRKNKVFLFLELCALGSLQSYMRKCKPLGRTTDDESREEENDFSVCTIDKLLASDMTRWSYEVANGMEFIASKHIVHLDIASRNVLLADPGRIVKITDFGLSRRMYDYQCYKKSEQEPLPWRWMAPESLRTSEFTEKSDVWGFGVLLWEIFSLGDEPYPGLSWDPNFPTKLERGLRLDEPAYNSNNMYSMMLGCWTTNPEGRPSFSEIVQMLSSKFKEAEMCQSGTAVSPEDSADSLTVIERYQVEGHVNQNDHENPPKSPPRRSWDGYVWLFLSLILLVTLTAVLILSVSSNGNDAPVGRIFGNGSVERNLSTEFPNSSSAHNSSGFDKNSSNVNDGMQTEIGSEPVVVQNRTNIGIQDNQMQRILSEKLFMAIDGMKEKAVEALILRGAPVNIRNQQGQSPLIRASHCGPDKGTCFRIIKYLIENGADVFAKDGNDGTFLHNLLGGPNANGSTLTPSQFHDLVIFLVPKNLTSLFNIPGYPTGHTPLNWAARTIEIQTQTLAILHQKGADFHAVNNLGRSILVEALRGGRSTEFFDELIKLGVAWNILDRSNNSMIHFAAFFGHMTGLKYFLKLGLNVDAPDVDGDTAIHLVIMSNGESNVLEVARILVENGANLSIRNYHGRTPLEEVIRNKDMKEEDKRDLIELLRDAEAEANRDSQLLAGRDSTSLGMALFNLIDRLNEDAIKILVELGANVNVRNDKSQTSLTRAATCGGENSLRICLRIIKYLISAGADVYAKDSGNQTFLHLLVSSDTYLTPAQLHGMAQFLIARNMTSLLMTRGGELGQTPLFNAVRYMTVEVATLTLLHDNGVNFDVVNYNGNSVLFYAFIEKRNMKLVSDIMKLGANCEYLNYMNQSLLHLAAAFGHLPGVKYFLEKGLDANAQDVNGATPLYMVAMFGKENLLEIAQLLIVGGADVTIEDNDGITPIIIVIVRDDLVDKDKVIQLLVNSEEQNKGI